LRCKIWERRVLFQFEIFYDCDIAGHVSVARLDSCSGSVEGSNQPERAKDSAIALALLQLCDCVPRLSRKRILQAGSQ
jgi:hypothetical protein